ncbi:competence protein CoiA family protein [Streptomyces sp. NPDC058770]|uniref:competence protein CoiA family protein n=1 Tax=Streptomyces sp. NPDC058770 TaxID=3346631 RepID=UPI0036C63BF0
MPFTALHPELGLLDSTLSAGTTWSGAGSTRSNPRVLLTCPDCSWGLHPKVSRYGVRFFCHDPDRPESCELLNESWEHHMLKLEMAGAIRAAGWFAALEVPAEDGSWRADVMASSADGSRRMAWEAQLSQITVDDIADRTDRYADEGIRVCWVHPGARPPRWISAVPAVRVRAPREREEPWVVDDGLAGFVYRSGRWGFREETLERFVRWALEGQLVPAEVLRRYRRVYRGGGRTDAGTSTGCAAASPRRRAGTDLAQRDAAFVALHDLPGPVHDGRPSDPFTCHTGTCTRSRPEGPQARAGVQPYGVVAGRAVRWPSQQLPASALSGGVGRRWLPPYSSALLAGRSQPLGPEVGGRIPVSAASP